MLVEQTLFLVLKLWLVLILVIATFSNPKQAAAISEHAGRKLAIDTQGYISIDCGATDDYNDNETGIFYESDTKYIDTGTINEISPDFTFKYFQQQTKKLRSFPNGTRNCYTMRPQQGKNSNYLIRAIIGYGNYDNKNQTPVFDLYLGVNKWVSVGVAERMYEIIHVPLTDYIQVCLVKTGLGVPHISALELRPLDSSAYQIKAVALYYIGLDDAGGEQDKITARYPVDVYDRIWSAPFYDINLGGIPISTNSTIDTQSNDDAYKLPAAVLRTARQTQNPSISLNLSFTPTDAYSRYFFYFHFTEIQKLENGKQRELRIDLNNRHHVTDSIRLEYLKPLTVVLNDTPISGVLHFSIYAAEGSDLPPILNAWELLVMVELPLSSTNLNDVNAIMDIKQTYKVTRNWQGDPCLPSDFLWDGLSCSNDSTPRITSLNLSSSKLTGEIDSSFFKLKEIQSLDLSYNNLSGSMPEFLAQLPNLRILNLIGNKLKGSVPDALMKKSNDGTLQLSVDETLDPCLSTPCPKKKDKKFIIPVLASIIAVLVILLTLSALVIYKMKRHEVMLNSKKKGSLKSRNQPFTYSEIVSITDNFRTVIGEGGFGKVYIGKLNDDTEVAVKILSSSSKQGYKEFRAEVQLLMIVHHRNLVSLIGYCDDNENMALIYEYMANGNLKQHLSETKTNILSWNERLQIAIDAAHGLEYLHNGCGPPIIHRDLKPANILLNENMQAKIADFGLSRVFKSESGTHVTTCLAGTPGYLDPDFHASGIFNKKSDVYSFGIILLELITGRPVMMRGAGNNSHILQWVSPFIERGDIHSIIDLRLEGEFNTNSAWKMVEIAMSCVPSTAIQRPDMSQVLVELKGCLAIEVPAGRTWRMEGHKTKSSNTLKVSYSGPDTQTTPSAR